MPHLSYLSLMYSWRKAGDGVRYTPIGSEYMLEFAEGEEDIK